MLLPSGTERQIRENVAIVDEKWFAYREPVSQIVDPSRRIEQGRLVPEVKGVAFVLPVGKRFSIPIRTMVGIHCKLRDPEVRDEVIERIRDQGPIPNGNERFREVIRERPQSLSESGSEDKGFTDFHHCRGHCSCNPARIKILPPFAGITFLRHLPPMAFLINGAKIEDEIFDSEFDSIKEHYQSLGEVVCCDRDEEFRTYARDNVINRTLLEQESRKRFGEIDDTAVEARFETLKEEHGSEQEFYDNTGLNPGDRAMILERLRSSMLVDRVLEADLDLPESADEAELESYYQENIDRFMSNEEVRVSQLFIEPSSHEAAKEAFLALREVRREILAGKDFELAAREHGSDGDRDIDLGFMKQGETMPEVEAITFSMEIGEVSPIIATHYGFHVFKVTDRKDSAPIPRAELPRLEEEYQSELRATQIEAILNHLKEVGTVEEISE